jgi:predicted Zn-dependent protease
MRCRKTLWIVLLTSAAWAAEGLPKLKPGFNLFSKQQDIELGQAAATEMVQQLHIVPNPDLKAADFPYSFTLVHEKSINAFALPGGPTFVHSGLILAADNEAGLAAVIAHEVSHVALRHGTNQATKALGVQILAGAGYNPERIKNQVRQLPEPPKPPLSNKK